MLKQKSPKISKATLRCGARIHRLAHMQFLVEKLCAMSPRQSGITLDGAESESFRYQAKLINRDGYSARGHMSVSARAEAAELARASIFMTKLVKPEAFISDISDDT